MSENNENCAVDPVHLNDRDNSGQKARPPFEVPAHRLHPPFLRMVKIGHKLTLRESVAVYVGGGEWVVSVTPDRIEYVSMPDNLPEAVPFFGAYLQGFLSGVDSVPVVCDSEEMSCQLIDGKFHFKEKEEYGS